MNTDQQVQERAAEVEALYRRVAELEGLLAEDQKGKPEGDFAREQLLLILQNHPEAVTYQPIVDLAWRDISTKDVVTMHKMGISTDGSWTGRDLREALNKMIQDYQRRMVAQAFGVSPESFKEPEEIIPPVP